MSTWAKAAKRKYADGGAVDDDHADDVPADDEQSMDETTPAGQRSKLERMLAGMNLPSETNVSGMSLWSWPSGFPDWWVRPRQGLRPWRSRPEVR